MNNKMRRKVFGGVVFFAAWMLTQAPSWADMVEVKGKGFLNGKIVSESDQEVHFEDSKGNASVFAKKDILFMERQADKPVSERTNISARAVSFASDWRSQIGPLFLKLKRATERWTKQAMGWLSKPLDRSMADSKAEQFAGATDQLGKTAGALASAESKRSKGMREALSSSSSEKEGRFSHL